MSTGDGGGPGEDQGSERKEERRRTPPPRRRTPPPRSSKPGGGRSKGPARGGEDGSVFGRLFGRKGLDDALEDRFRAYEFQSTRPMLRWVFLSLLLFIAAGAFAIYADLQFRDQMSAWQSEGFTQIPVDNDDIIATTFVLSIDGEPVDICAAEERLVTATPTPDLDDPNAEPETPIGNSILLQSCRALERVLEHPAAVENGCTDYNDLTTAVLEEGALHPGCERTIATSGKYESLTTTSAVSTIAVIITIVIAAFPFSSYLHRSSRNLRTMRSEGQKRSPDGTVIRFFIPFVNLYEPIRIIIELFKGSDPRVTDKDHTAWQKKGQVHPIAFVWGLLWPAMLVFNSFIVARMSTRADLADIGTLATRLLISDVIVIALGIAAILMTNSLSKWQDARAAKHGTVTVTPPRPRDSLEKALSEDSHRRDISSTGAQRERKKKRGKK